MRITPSNKYNFLAILIVLTNLISLFGINKGMAARPNYIANESPAADSVRNTKTPLEELQPKKAIQPQSVFPELKQKMKNLPPFWRDTSVNLHLRSYYFNSDIIDANRKEAWALGGWLGYESGWWKNLLKVGGVGYTSQKLYGPEDRDGTLLLKPGQEGFSILGQAYLRARVAEGVNLRLYRQSLELPYINKDDSRMVPNTFEAYTFDGESIRNIDFIVSHITKMKTRNSSEFRYMSEVAGFPDTDKGLTMGGASYSFTEDIYIGVISQYSWDLWNTAYAEATGVWTLTEEVEIGLSAQYTDQRSVGDALDGVFSTSVFGAKVASSYQGAIMSFSFTSTDNDRRIRRPYGGTPSYVSLMQSKFDRPGEDAWQTGLSYDFRFVGIDGLSAFVDYARGNTPDSGPAASPDQEEFDLTVDYRFKKGPLERLWLRFRGAVLNQRGPNAQDTVNFRIILNYDLPML
ncbi:MAG: OprD family outer membrane porin [Desulfobacterales bacterium]